MAVCCQRCGRGYDVTLFEFGRTIWCTCGQRVGIEPRVRDVRRGAAVRLAADAMLGRLARWLRLLGFDCSWDAEIGDEELVHHALSEGRAILTRDRRLPEAWWVSEIYVVEAEEVRHQLAEVIDHFELAPAIRVLTRCSACNEPLRPLPLAAAEARVPARVRERHDRFSECPVCARVYWEGTHAARIRAFVERLLAERAREAERRGDPAGP